MKVGGCALTILATSRSPQISLARAQGTAGPEWETRLDKCQPLIEQGAAALGRPLEPALYVEERRAFDESWPMTTGPCHG